MGKFLFFSPHALLDSSSGAGLCISVLLGELAKLGHSCAAVTGSLVDGPNQLFAKAVEGPPTGSIKVSLDGQTLPVHKVNFHGAAHYIASFASASPLDLRASEEVGLRTLFLEIFNRFDPDVLLTYGGYMSNYHAGQHALAKGRRSVLYVASDSYLRGDDHRFAHVNMIHTVSEALRRELDKATNLPKVVTQTFVDRADVVAAQRTPEFITFVNPIPEKGVRIAATLAAECQRRGKPYKFLFVEGRGTHEALFAMCPELKELENLSIAANTSNVRNIYERTALCIYPSVYLEAASRVAIEANANGIPVLACDRGGIPEMLDGAGFLFEPPEASRNNHDAPVPAAYVDRWIETIDRLHNEPAFMTDAVKRAKTADARYDPERMARRFADAVAVKPYR
jgi:glycosyltransferase involved in cell wall biosynthesis